jgi:hypothetical protein
MQKGHPKPPICDPQATIKPSGWEGIATHKPPSSHPHATCMRPPSHPQATPKPRGTKGNRRQEVRLGPLSDSGLPPFRSI